MSVDTYPPRSRSALPATRPARLAVAIVSALALVLGLAPAAAAQTASSRLVDFTFAGVLNSGGSNLRPGGHVRLDITATNTHGSGCCGLSTRVLNTYGFVMPAGFTAGNSGGSHMESVGDHDQSNYFGGQPGGVTSSARRVGSGESRSGWLSYNIPQNALGGSSHSFRIKAHIGTGGSWHGPAGETLTFTLPAVATTTQAITVTPTTGRVGESTTLSTRVTANHGTNTPTGTVRFTVDGQTLDADVVNGIATTTTSFSTAGSKSTTATYLPGNTSQWSGSSRTGTVDIQTEATRTSLALDPVEVHVGGTIQASASVTPAGAQGEIEFSAGGDPVRIPVGADGTASVELPAGSTGEMTLTATFIPTDPQRYTSSSDRQTVDVYAPTSTSTAISVDAEPVQAGRKTILAAAVSPETAAGTVTFTIDGQTHTVTVIDGTATLEHTFLAAGDHVVVADFTPTDTGRYLPSSGQATVIVQAEATRTELTLDPVEITAGGEVTATAQITPSDADGQIRFDYGEQTRTVSVAGGQASTTFTAPSAGTGTITATFIPTDPGRYNGSTDSQAVEIEAEATNTGLTLDATEVIEGGTVRASATVTPAGAQGDVEFTAGETTVSVPVDADGTATADLRALASGVLTATATFIPTDPGRYSGSADSQTITVLEQIATSTSLTVDSDPTRVDEQTTLTANVTPTDTAGTVTFTIGGQTHTVTVVNGIATLEHTFLAAGDHVVVADFNPTDTDRHLASSGHATVNVEVEATTTALTLDRVEVTAGGTIQATAAVTPAGAAGDVEFTAGETIVSVPVGIDGTATAELPAGTAGVLAVTATFIPRNPDRYTSSTGSQNVEIDAETTQTDLTLNAVEVTAGGEVTATAQITPPDADGRVRFDYGEQTRTVSVAGGQASTTFAAPSAGTGTITATFIPADPDRYSGSTDTQPVDVAAEATQTEIAVSADPARVGRETTITATVTPAAAAGTVTFTIDGQTYPAQVTGGVAMLAHTFTKTGHQPITADFTPTDTGRYDASTDTQTVDVQGEVEVQPTTVEVDAGTAEVGQEVTLTATVSPADADGEVRFTVDGVEHLVPVVNGVATLVHTAGQRGSYTVRAEFIPADPSAYAPSGATETLIVRDEEGPGPGTEGQTTGALGLLGLIGSIGVGAMLHSSGSLASLGS